MLLLWEFKSLVKRYSFLCVIAQKTCNRYNNNALGLIIKDITNNCSISFVLTEKLAYFLSKYLLKCCVCWNIIKQFACNFGLEVFNKLRIRAAASTPVLPLFWTY